MKGEIIEGYETGHIHLDHPNDTVKCRHYHVKKCDPGGMSSVDMPLSTAAVGCCTFLEQSEKDAELGSNQENG